VSWQAAGPGPGGGSGGDDLFTAVEADVRAMASQPWWPAAPPQQKAQAVSGRMLSGTGEWWLFGAWGRWYRCGLDGNWTPCPPPADPAVRRRAAPAPRAGNPPVPPQLFPTGPDLMAGPAAAAGFLGEPPDSVVVARLQHAQISALNVNPAQFALGDPTFQPGTPSTLAAAWGALLWCAGAPVTLDAHPMVEMFVPFLTTPAERLRWMTPPDFSTLAGYYVARLGAGDWGGATAIVRVMHDVAAGLAGDGRFQPGADALAAITAATLPLVQHDMAALRYGPAAVLAEWRRRCPAQHALPMVRDAAPGEYLRLGLYDLQQLVAALAGQPTDHNEVRRAGIAVLAADLEAAPAAAAAVAPWLDPDGARHLHAVLSDPAHPGRRVWPQDGRLPEPLRGDADTLRALLATSYMLGLTWCRLAQSPPPATGFAVAAAAATALTSGLSQEPPSTDELDPWRIIDAARAHLAAERASTPTPVPPPEAAPPEPPVPDPPALADPVYTAERAREYTPPHTEPAQEPASPAAFAQDAPSPPPAYAPPQPVAPYAQEPPPAYEPAPSFGPPPAYEPPPAYAPPPRYGSPPGYESPPPYEPPGAAEPPGYLPPSAQTIPYRPAQETAVPAPPPTPAPEQEPPPATRIAEAYGIRFLCGPDDIERLITEVRRRAKWAQRLRGQEVSSASMPALLLIGAASTGQRRLGRMVARALADVQVSSGQLRSVHCEELRERGPDGLRSALEAHAGHALLLEGLDSLVLDDGHGPDYAAALYRARVEGVSDTALLATCEPDRLGELSALAPELVTDLRAVRLADLAAGPARADLLELLAHERQLRLDAGARDVVRRDAGALRGRGRLTNARLVEAYLDRACTRHLGRAARTQAIGSGALVLEAADFEGLAAELSPGR
jgi:hypothetical protein